MTRQEYLKMVYDAEGEQAIKVLAPEDKRIVANLKDRDIQLFIEDPRARICIIRTVNEFRKGTNEKTNRKTKGD